MLINPINGSNAGVTLWYFEDLKVNHANGDGIRWDQGGDGFVFVKPQFFRADSETGYSCNWTSTNPNDIMGHCCFFYPIATGGMNFVTPGLHYGNIIHGYDGINVNSNKGNSLLTGAGHNEFLGISASGQEFGISRLKSQWDVLADDTMNLNYYDGAGGASIFYTNNGSWFIGTASVTGVASADEAGGGIVMATTNSSGNNTTISHSAAANGVSLALRPAAMFGIKITQTSDIKVRWGFFSNNADPPTEGVYVEYDPTVSSGQYRLISKNAAGTTAVVNPAGWGGSTNPIFRWRIHIMPARAVFYAAAPNTANAQIWAYLGTITTNLPNDLLAVGVQLVTTAAAVANVTVGHIKIAQRVEYL